MLRKKLRHRKSQKRRVHRLLAWSILLTIFCAIFGIIPLVYGIKALSRYNHSDPIYVNYMIKGYIWLRNCSVAFICIYSVGLIFLAGLYYFQK